MSLTGLGTDLGQVAWELRAGPMGMFPPDGHLCNFHEKMKYRQCGTTMISRKNKKEKKKRKENEQEKVPPQCCWKAWQGGECTLSNTSNSRNLTLSKAAEGSTDFLYKGSVVV